MNVSARWTCGECGDSYEATGSGARFEVGQWTREHKERHRVDKLPEDERQAYQEHRMDVETEAIRLGAQR
jgi:hypothetical protein